MQPEDSPSTVWWSGAEAGGGLLETLFRDPLSEPSLSALELMALLARPLSATSDGGPSVWTGD